MKISDVLNYMGNVDCHLGEERNIANLNVKEPHTEREIAV